MNEKSNITGEQYLTDSEFIISLGTKFSEFICRKQLDLSEDNLGLLETKLNIYHDKQLQIIIIPDRISYILNLEHKPLTAIPLKLPMIVKPKPYSDKLKGGYLSNNEYEIIELIKDKPHYKYTSMINKVNNIYDMVKHMSGVPYKINYVLLDFLFEKGIEFGITLGTPTKFIPDPSTSKKIIFFRI